MDKGDLFTSVVQEIFKLYGLLYFQEGDRLARGTVMTPARWRLLGTLLRNGGAMRVPEIAREVQQARQSVQRLVNDMMAEDLVAYGSGAGRSRPVVITAAGEDLYHSLQGRQQQWAQELAANFSRSELDQLHSQLARLIGCLNDSSRPEQG